MNGGYALKANFGPLLCGGHSCVEWDFAFGEIIFLLRDVHGQAGIGGPRA